MIKRVSTTPNKLDRQLLEKSTKNFVHFDRKCSQGKEAYNSFHYTIRACFSLIRFRIQAQTSSLIFHLFHGIIFIPAQFSYPTITIALSKSSTRRVCFEKIMFIYSKNFSLSVPLFNFPAVAVRPVRVILKHFDVYT